MSQHEEQHEEEHDPGVGAADEKEANERPTSEEFKSNVYVGNLPQSITDEALKDLFAKYGEVVRCKIARHRGSNLPTGYGFVLFDTVENATKACTALNGSTYENRQLKVSIANPPGHKYQNQTNIYIAGLSPSFSLDQLYEVFVEYGKILDHRLLLDNDGQPRGVGFVKYETHEQAAKAIQARNGSKLEESDKPIVVKFARDNTRRLQQQQQQRYQQRGFRYPPQMERYMYEMQQFPQPRFQSPDGYPIYIPFPQQYPQIPLNPRPKTNIYVAGLHQNITKEEFEELFSKFGTILGSRILTNSSGGNRGVGFVRFDNPKSASDAVNNLNGQTPPKFSQPLSVKFARENNHYQQHQQQHHHNGGSMHNNNNNRRFSNRRNHSGGVNDRGGIDSYQGHFDYMPAQRYAPNIMNGGGNVMNPIQSNLPQNALRQNFQPNPQFPQGQGQNQYPPLAFNQGQQHSGAQFQGHATSGDFGQMTQSWIQPQ